MVHTLLKWGICSTNLLFINTHFLQSKSQLTHNADLYNSAMPLKLLLKASVKYNWGSEWTIWTFLSFKLPKQRHFERRPNFKGFAIRWLWRKHIPFHHFNTVLQITVSRVNINWETLFFMCMYCMHYLMFTAATINAINTNGCKDQVQTAAVSFSTPMDSIHF